MHAAMNTPVPQVVVQVAAAAPAALPPKSESRPSCRLANLLAALERHHREMRYDLRMLTSAESAAPQTTDMNRMPAV